MAALTARQPLRDSNLGAHSLHVVAPKTETEQATASANLETKRGPWHVSLRSNCQPCRWSRQALPFGGFAAGDPTSIRRGVDDAFFAEVFYHKLDMLAF